MAISLRIPQVVGHLSPWPGAAKGADQAGLAAAAAAEPAEAASGRGEAARALAAAGRDGMDGWRLMGDCHQWDRNNACHSRHVAESQLMA